MRAMAESLTWIGWRALLLAGVCVNLGVSNPAAHAATVEVATNGSDSATCGAASTPCRSISQAIANASAGDTIVVGPGHYGDLNGNGTFGESGEEPAEVGFGCFCMIKVDKSLTLLSRDGSATTVLDAGGANVRDVQIEVSGVEFGNTKQGFTLTGTDVTGVGLSVDGSASGVKVTGNLATRRVQGFTVGGASHTLTGNVATDNSADGFVIFGSGHVVTGNVASGNGGFGLAPGFSGTGFAVGGTGHQLTGNQASANGAIGVALGGSGHVVTGNAALGNQGFGILIVAGGTATLSKNNLYGNNVVADSGTGLTNCGLRNASGGAITASNNFWGAATGPGPDPADAVCDDAGNGSMTVYMPFATKEFKIKQP